MALNRHSKCLPHFRGDALKGITLTIATSNFNPTIKEDWWDEILVKREGEHFGDSGDQGVNAGERARKECSPVLMFKAGKALVTH